MKRILALILATLLLAGLCACGSKTAAPFRALETVGTKHYSAVCRGGDKLALTLMAAMETLAGNGTLSALSVRWLGSDRICMEGDAAALSRLEELPEPRTLIFGVEAGFLPLGYTENDEVCGLCADIAKAVGELLGWEIRLLGIDAEEVGAQLNSGNIDCALGFDSGLVSTSKFTVGDCFLESDIILAVRSESETKKLRDLDGTRIGTIDDPIILKAIRADEKITKHAAGATEYLSLDRCIEALDKGWCSAVVLDSLMLAYYRGSQA